MTRERIRQIEAEGAQETQAPEPVTEAQELPGSVGWAICPPSPRYDRQAGGQDCPHCAPKHDRNDRAPPPSRRSARSASCSSPASRSAWHPSSPSRISGKSSRCWRRGGADADNRHSRSRDARRAVAASGVEAHGRAEAGGLTAPPSPEGAAPLGSRATHENGARPCPFFSRLFGGSGAAPEPEPEVYKDFRIFPEPQADSGGFRIAGRIEKEMGRRGESPPLPARRHDPVKG